MFYTYLKIDENVLQYLEVGDIMKVNYNLVMESIIKENQEKGIKPSLLLHVCCAPCSSAALEKLIKYFNITIYYYNPNISPITEYKKRVSELKKFLHDTNMENEVNVIEGEYDNSSFDEIARGFEHEKEGGTRCFKCYYLRLNSTAKLALEKKFDYFTTTLSISPYKSASKLNEIGSVLEKKYGVKYLYSDFKKKDGYKRSIELSYKYNLYRQNYCGCIYSYEVMKNEKADI